MSCESTDCPVLPAHIQHHKEQCSGGFSHIQIDKALFTGDLLQVLHRSKSSQEDSDFGDLFHLFALPYCEEAVLERDLAETLRQIKRNHSILNSVEIGNIEYLDRFRFT